MKNIKFNYMYRDASNYKRHGQVVFSDPDGTDLKMAAKILEGTLLTDGLFIADQVRIPDVFLYEGIATSDDHCFHESCGWKKLRGFPMIGTVARSLNSFQSLFRLEGPVGVLSTAMSVTSTERNSTMQFAEARLRPCS